MKLHTIFVCEKLKFLTRTVATIHTKLYSPPSTDYTIPSFIQNELANEAYIENMVIEPEGMYMKFKQFMHIQFWGG